MMEVFIALKFSAADSYEGYPVPVARIQIGVNLENKSTEFFIFRTDRPISSGPALRHRGNADKTIQHFLDTKIINSRSEKHRRYFPAQVICYIQRSVYAIHQFHVFA